MKEFLTYSGIMIVFILIIISGSNKTDYQEESDIIRQTKSFVERETDIAAFLPGGQEEYDIIRRAADRNNCTGEYLTLLFAIRMAENGSKGLELGIMDPRAKNTNLDTQAGWAAATIMKNRDRYMKSNRSVHFIVFLGERYCPPEAHDLNQHWVKNVRYWFDRFQK